MSPQRELWMIAGLLTVYVILGVSLGLVIAAVRS